MKCKMHQFSPFKVEIGASVFVHTLAVGNAEAKLKCEYPGLRYRGSMPPASVSYLPTGFPVVDDLRPRDFCPSRFGTASRLQYRFCVGTFTPFLVPVAGIIPQPRRHFSLLSCFGLEGPGKSCQPLVQIIAPCKGPCQPSPSVDFSQIRAFSGIFM